MLDLTNFIGSTSTVGAGLAYQIDGTVVPDSSAVFETVQSDLLLLKGSVTFELGGKTYKIMNGMLETRTTTQNQVILGYSIDGGSLMEQTFTYSIPSGDANELDLTLASVAVKKDLLAEIEHKVVSMLIGIESAIIKRVPSQTSGQTDTLISATNVFGMTIAATLVPAPS